MPSTMHEASVEWAAVEFNVTSGCVHIGPLVLRS